ncbi:MAG TPA: ABC transporter substrate-binding protein [Chloroflexota bacterium]|nr:ABC transporter substrate-binding protein [Chloroflexota bacterium]
MNAPRARANMCATGGGRSRRGVVSHVVAGVLVLAFAACAAPSSPSKAPGTPAAPAQRSGPKALTIALPVEPPALGGSVIIGVSAVPSRYFREFPNAYLTTHDPQDQPAPWLAAALPSLDDGTWKVLDDGRMEVTWKLRPGIKWQDGAALTSDDLGFSWEIGKDLTTGVASQSVARYIDSVATPDPLTAVFTWGTVSSLGGVAGVRELDVLPRHVLDAAERVGLADNPYFTDPAVFVGSGPFRPTAWERGRSISLEAFHDYFLGRPKIDQVIFSIIPDPSTALTSVLSGQVDVGFWAINYEGAKVLQHEWKSTGGTVDMQANNARHVLPQFRPEYASPRELLDVGVRRALMYALDRDELAETAAAGAARPTNSTTYPDSALGRVVEAAAPRYDYDPARAAALFAEAGWQKGADGMLSKGGERFQLQYRTGAGATDGSLIFAVMQQQLKRSGVDLEINVAPGADLQAGATFSGLSFRGLPDNQTGFLALFNSAMIAGAQNRWFGTNVHGYNNPAADELLVRVDKSLQPDARMAAWAEANRALLEDVAYMPLYNYPFPYLVRAGITGPLPANPINPPSYFVHTWDLQ